jgi:hypothetical protein
LRDRRTARSLAFAQFRTENRFALFLELRWSRMVSGRIDLKSESVSQSKSEGRMPKTARVSGITI